MASPVPLCQLRSSQRERVYELFALSSPVFRRGRVRADKSLPHSVKSSPRVVGFNVKEAAFCA